jgi:hypothetical protein
MALENLWTSSPLWNGDYHVLSKPVPYNAFLFGLVLIDFTNNFKRITRVKTSELEIPFQYMDEIPPWAKGANYQEIGDIMGRFEPVNIYSNSGGQDLQLQLHYVSEAKYDAGATTPWTMEKIEKITNKLKSLVYPMYDKTYAPPLKVLLNIGHWFHNIPVLIKNVNVVGEPPIDTETGLPRNRKITLDCRINYPMWQNITAPKVFTGQDSSTIFAYEELQETAR